MRNKLILIGGGLVLLIALWIGYKSLTKDSLRPKVDAIVQTNYEALALSNAAQANLSDFDLQVAAANLSATLASHDSYLAAYYKGHYHKKLPAAPKSYASVTKLASTQPGSAYDGTYKSDVQNLLTANLTAIKAADDQTSNQTLKAILDQMLADQTKLLNQLEQ